MLTRLLGECRNDATGSPRMLDQLRWVAPFISPSGSVFPMDEQATFAWGVGTSAYQIEGAWDVDGKGESIWDRFLHASGHEPNGDTACDHYFRLDEDLDLLVELGVTAYRFSTAWTRILPQGTGEVNNAGLAFYDRLVDGLLTRGIEPWLTLYHWDLPQALQERGGWPSRQSVAWFAEYTEVMARHFRGRVNRWITVNEPWVSSFVGHLDGVFAPGSTDWHAALRSGHHQLLAHGEAVRIIKKYAPGSSVGIALDCRYAIPASNSPEDVDAAKHFDGFRNRWFFDPVFGKGYPDDIIKAYETLGRLPEDMIREGDMATISEPMDFCGINFYTSLTIDSDSAELEQSEGPVGAPAAPGYTEMGWKVDPDALGSFLRRVHNDWDPPPLVITENGASYSEAISSEGRVHDVRRIDYLARHIQQIEDARREGIAVEGYFVWSFLDNLEWVAGFDQQFGVIHVDHDSQQRTIKDSGHWYREHIAASTTGRDVSGQRLEP
jgi:beta-glucosidase